MDYLEKYYDKKNFTLYALFMPLPGTNACHRKVFVTFSVLVLSFATIFQVMKFVTDGFTLELMVELVPTIAAIFGCLVYITYVTFAIQGQFEKILSAMQNDLKEERTAKENEIKRQFASSAKLFTSIYTGLLIATVCGMPLAGFLPHFYDVLMSVNNTRHAELLFKGEIFIDLQQYFYYIYFMECCTAVVVGLLVVISENISIIIGRHTCGMFAVVGHQLETLSEIGGQELSDKNSYEDLLTRRLQTCIEGHQKALEFAVIASEFYDIPLSLILTGCFCTLVMSLVQVTDPELASIKMVLFTCTQFCQLFLMSYMGQASIDASLRVSQNAYNAKWDNFPMKVRKLLQMVILRSSKPCLVLVRGIYVLSIENCMSVVQTIMSFYMVIRQSH